MSIIAALPGWVLGLARDIGVIAALLGGGAAIAKFSKIGKPIRFVWSALVTEPAGEWIHDQVWRALGPQAQEHLEQTERDTQAIAGFLTLKDRLEEHLAASSVTDARVARLDEQLVTYVITADSAVARLGVWADALSRQLDVTPPGGIPITRKELS